MTISLKNKLLAISISFTVFSVLATIFIALMGGKPERALLLIPTLAIGISLFEEFYVQHSRGKWLRIMHPAKSILIYTSFIMIFSLSMILFYRGIMPLISPPDIMTTSLKNPPSLFFVLPIFAVISVIAILILRLTRYMGIQNMINLITGKYYRPIQENKMFLFLDIKGSTSIVENLGSIKTRELLGKFFFDISAPITDHGGEIYRFTGDGVVAVWDWSDGIDKNHIIQAIDAIANSVNKESDFYLSQFNHIPSYRIGVHGGNITISEEGDTKRAIGFYGKTIHIAARLEQKAKELNKDCIFSADVAQQLENYQSRFQLIGDEPIRGIQDSLKLYELSSPIENK